MLKDVWECEEAAFFGDDIPQILYSGTRLLASKDLREPLVKALFIVDRSSSVICSLLAE